MRRSMRRALSLLLLGSLLWLPGTSAQVIRDGSLGSAPPGLVPGGVDDLGQDATYLIEETLGIM